MRVFAISRLGKKNPHRDRSIVGVNDDLYYCFFSLEHVKVRED